MTAGGLSWGELAGLFGHFMLLSLLSVGGAIAAAPDMHRYAVVENGWLSDAQFTSSIAIAQGAPGPNVLFVAAIGWNIAGPIGALVTMIGILLPSTTVALAASRWGARRAEARGVRAFTSGMAPITVGLVLATGWLLTEPARGDWALIAIVVAATLVSWRTRLSPIWLIAAGAGLGAVMGAAGVG